MTLQYRQHVLARTAAPRSRHRAAGRLRPPRVAPWLPVRLLLVDDDADLRELMRRALALICEVELAVDGAAALVRLRAGGRRQRAIDLVVTDLTMPRLDGLGLLAAIRADPRLRGLPVILISALAPSADAAGPAAAAQGYLRKPFALRQLVRRVWTEVRQLRQARRRWLRSRSRLRIAD